MNERHEDEEQQQEEDSWAEDDQKDTLGEYYRGISRCDD